MTKSPVTKIIPVCGNKLLSLGSVDNTLPWKTLTLHTFTMSHQQKAADTIQLVSDNNHLTVCE